MQLKTLIDGEIELVEYDRDELRHIFLERNSWVLKRTHEWGDDYGGSHVTDNSETMLEEIIPERVLVEDGDFCGVVIQTEYECYNGGSNGTKYEDVVLRTDGTINDFAKDGFSFSNDDHDRWNYTTWRLIERSDDM